MSSEGLGYDRFISCVQGVLKFVMFCSKVPYSIRTRVIVNHSIDLQFRSINRFLLATGSLKIIFEESDFMPVDTWFNPLMPGGNKEVTHT